MYLNKLFGTVCVLCTLTYCVNSDIVFDVVSEFDPCDLFCQNTYPNPSSNVTLIVQNFKRAACCSQGCRFFNLVFLTENKDSPCQNTTLQACKSSCEEAYDDDDDRNACFVGCDSTPKQVENDEQISQFSWSVYFGNVGTGLLFQTGDSEPDDVLTDPVLRRQLDRNWGFDGISDKLPETHVKTLPIVENENVNVGIIYHNDNDWLDCAARRSGLPRLILASCVVLGVLLVLYLFLAPDRPNLDYLKISEKPQELPQEFPQAEELPPKYSLIQEKV